MKRLATLRSFARALIAFAFVVTGLAGTAQADLARVGPVDPAHGYPVWYQDHTGLALGLCLPDQIDLEAGNCLLLPPDVPLGTAPESFPTNFADEHFWWAAGSALDTQGPDGTISESATLTVALEAAFNAGVAPGGQIAFGRIRVKITAVPSDGDYRIIHPYGVLHFPGLAAGDKIFYTDDVGLTCATGDFSCALASGVGPFLRASATPGGAPLDPVAVNGKLMIADPITPTFVTGGIHSVFRVEGPNIGGPGIDFVETNLFDLMGRVHTAPIPSPLTADGAVYTRRGGGTAWIDVFASALPGIGKPDPVLSIAGSGIESKGMTHGGNGRYWGQSAVTGAAVPAQVRVVNSADQPPTVVDAVVSDRVTITEAVYDPVARALRVKARSSDEGSDAPTLYLPQYGNLSCDNVVGRSIDLGVAPATVTVRSTAGGSATASVEILQGERTQVIIADQFATGEEDTAITLSLARAGSGGVVYTILSQPVHGTVSVGADGLAAYIPAPNYHGADQFTYTVFENGQTSNIATVSITVLPVNDAPTAVNDGATTTLGTPVSIDLLANDSDPDGAAELDRASVVVSDATVGVVNGVATFPATAAGTFSFTYTVADAQGVRSNDATVTVRVDVAETLAIARSEYIASKTRWRVEGTSTVLANQTVTVRLANGSQAGTLIGTAIVDAAGLWALDAVGSAVRPLDSTRVSATSPLGGDATASFRTK